MKKNLLLFLAILAFGFSELAAQNFLSVSPVNPNKNPQYPVLSEQSYSTVINVSGSKVDLMNNLKAFLINSGYGIDEEIAAVKIEESMNEFRFPLFVMEGQSLVKGAMGLKMIAPPVLLHSEAVLTFDDNDPSKVTMTITNFEGSSICRADDDHVLNLIKKSVSKDVGLGQYEENEYDKKVTDEGGKLLTLGSGVGALLIVTQAGTEAYEKTVEEFKKQQKDQFDIYEDAMKHGSLEMITKDNIEGYGLAGYTGKSEKYWIDMRDNFKAGTWVIGMNKTRWENDFQPYYDNLFRRSAVVMGGTIQSVSFNDEMLYELYEGKVLPVDPKERKKWIKKDKSY